MPQVPAGQRERLQGRLKRAQTAGLGLLVLLAIGSTGSAAVTAGPAAVLTATNNCSSRPVITAGLIQRSSPQHAAAADSVSVAAVPGDDTPTPADSPTADPTATPTPTPTDTPTTQPTNPGDNGSTGGQGTTANIITVTSPGDQTNTVGDTVSLPIVATDSDTTQTLTYTDSGTLPAGLAIDSGTGIISGSPTTAGTSSVTITVTDPTGAAGTATFNWTVNPATPPTSSGGGGATTPPPTTPPAPPPAPVLCVTVSPYLSSSVLPGATASFAIFVWSTNVDASGAKVTATVGTVSGVKAPTFGICSSAKANVCTVGDLATDQAQELLAGSAVGLGVKTGTKITLTATAQASGATAVKASSTITVTAASAIGSSTSAPTSLNAGLPELGLPSLPGLSLPGGTLPEGAFTTPTNPSNLFPTVSPGASQAAKAKKHPAATIDSAILPLDSKTIGWQIAGIVLLIVGIVIAVVRLSLRARPQEGPGTQPEPAS